MKKLICTFSVVLALFIAFTMFAVTETTSDLTPVVYAAVTNSGTLGNNITWTLDDAGVLTISGTGAIPSAEDENSDFPWSKYSSSVKEIVIGNGIINIGSYSFYGFEELLKVTFSETVEDIGNRAFFGCLLLNDIQLPSDTYYIGTSAFGFCESIEEINIPDSVSIIRSTAFEGCISLTDINVSSENEDFTSENGILYSKEMDELIIYPAGKTDEVVTIPASVTTISENAFAYCDFFTDVVFEDGCIIQYIEEAAFYDCDSFLEFYIPATITSIGANAFGSCDNFCGVYVDEYNEHYSADMTGILYNKDRTTLISYPCGRLEYEFTIPGNVTTISSAAFSECNSLEILTFDSAHEIILETGAIYDCDGLQEVRIYNGITTVTMGSFFDCGNLTKIILSSAVTELKSYSFFDCNSIDSLIILNKECKIPSDALGDTYTNELKVYGYSGFTAENFAKSAGIEFVSLYDGVEWTFSGGSVIVGSESETVTEINTDKLLPWSLFAQQTELIMLRNISIISDNLFRDFEYISTVIVYGNDTTINSGTFADCEYLTSLISFSDLNIADNAIPADTKVFTEKAKTTVYSGSVISFYYEDGIISFEQPVSVDFDDFFNILIALCSNKNYGEIKNLKFAYLETIGFMFLHTDELSVSEITSFEDITLTVKIPEGGEYKAISFTEFCEGIADGTINKFIFSVENTEGEEVGNMQGKTIFEKLVGYGLEVIRVLIDFFCKMFGVK